MLPLIGSRNGISRLLYGVGIGAFRHGRAVSMGIPRSPLIPTLTALSRPFPQQAAGFQAHTRRGLSGIPQSMPLDVDLALPDMDTAGDSVLRLQQLRQLEQAKEAGNIDQFLVTMTALVDKHQQLFETCPVDAAVVPFLREMPSLLPAEQLGTCIWCFGGLGLPTEDAVFQAAILKYLEHIDQQSTTSLFQGMRGLHWAGYALASFSEAQQAALLAALEVRLTGISGNDLATLSTNLMLGVAWESLPGGFADSLWRAYAVITKCSPEDATDMLLATAGFGIRAEWMNAEQAQPVHNLLSMALQVGNVGNVDAKRNLQVLSSMRDMGFSFAALPDDLKRVIEGSLSITLQHMQADQLLRVMQALETMGYSWSSFSPVLRDAVICCVERCGQHEDKYLREYFQAFVEHGTDTQKTSPRQLISFASVVPSNNASAHLVESRVNRAHLAMIREARSVKSKGTTTEFIDKVLALAVEFKRVLRYGTKVSLLAPLAVEMAAMLPREELGKGIWYFSCFGIPVDDRAFHAIVWEFFDCIDQQSTTSLFQGMRGLHWAGYALANFREAQQAALLDTLEARLGDMSVEQFSALPLILANLGGRWVSLPEQFTQSLWHNVQKIANECSAADRIYAGRVLGSLSCVDIPMDAERARVFCTLAMNALQAESSASSAEGNATVIKGLESLGIRYASLPAELKQHMEVCLIGTFPHLRAAQLYRVMWVLEAMGYEWSNYSPALLDATISAAATNGRSAGQFEEEYFNDFLKKTERAATRAAMRVGVGRHVPREVAIPSSSQGSQSNPSMPPADKEPTKTPLKERPEFILTEAMKHRLRKANWAKVEGDKQKCFETTMALVEDLRLIIKGDQVNTVNPLVESLPSIVPKDSLGACIWCFGALLFPKDNAAFQATMKKFFKQIDQQSTTSLFQGMRGLCWAGYALASFSEAQQTALLSAVEARMQGMSVDEVTDLPVVLRSFGAMWPSLPEHFTQSMWKSVQKLANGSTSVDYHMASSLLANLALHDMPVNAERVQVLYNLAMNVLQMEGNDAKQSKINALGNVRTVVGLASLGFKYADLPDDLQKHLSACLLSTLPSMKKDYFCKIVIALDDMGLPWAVFPPALRNATEYVRGAVLQRERYGFRPKAS